MPSINASRPSNEGDMSTPLLAVAPETPDDGVKKEISKRIKDLEAALAVLPGDAAFDEARSNLQAKVDALKSEAAVTGEDAAVLKFERVTSPYCSQNSRQEQSNDLVERCSIEFLLTALLRRTKDVKAKEEDHELEEVFVNTASAGSLDRIRASYVQHVRKRFFLPGEEKDMITAGLDAVAKRQQESVKRHSEKSKDLLVKAWEKFAKASNGQGDVAESERAVQAACRESSMLLSQGKQINLPLNPFIGGAETVISFALLCFYTSVIFLFLIDQGRLPRPLTIVSLTYLCYAILFKFGMKVYPNFRIFWSGTFYAYVRLRVSYFLLFNLVIVVATFAGILIETFCAFITDAFPQATWHGIPTKSLAYLFFFLLPLLIVVFSLYCQFCFKLALDTFDSPPLISFQSALLAFLHRQPHPHEHHDVEGDVAETEDVHWLVRFVDRLLPHNREQDKLNKCTVKRSTCMIVDFITISIGEVLPMVWAIIGVVQYWGFSDRSHLGAGLRAWLWAGMASAMAMTWLFIFCHLVFAVRDRYKKSDREIETKSYAEARECFDLALNRNLVFPGTLTFHHKECFESYLFDKNILGANSAAALETQPVYRIFNDQIPVDYIGHLAWMVFWFVVVHIAGSWLSKGDHSSCYFIAASMIVTVLFITALLNQRFPGVIGMTYYGVNFFFLLVGLGLLSAASLDIRPPSDTSIVRHPNYDWEPDMSRSAIRPSANWTGGPTSYPVCRIPWGAEGAPLNALDISQLSGLMYAGNCSNISESLKKVFPNIPACVDAHGEDSRTWHDCRNFHSCSEYHQFPRIGVFDFYPPQDDSSSLVTRIVAFKGTSTSKDIFLDSTLWSTVKVLQAFGVILPVISIMPLDQVQWMLDIGHLPGEMEAEREFWKNAQGTVEAFIEEGFHTTLTGHSLGGGVAQVVAARLGLPALVMSAPGMGYSGRRFGIHRSQDWSASSLAFWKGIKATMGFNVTEEHAGVESSAHRTIVVMPESDVVPRADLQVGVVQPIECRVNDGQYGGALNCHSIDKTSCEIWRSCGDWPSRGRMIDCNKYVDASEIGVWYKPDDI